ncbi:hypothetical protein B0I35DRAFT_47517 [Stachybotrys elegans]|uniref:Uncharacterized protein n=1 Tax=Stachybotrys elegans TaxID=80388 RepID=A0A8K0T696_9HYPO|nr:hypothetical protein B0I35DRAFT_47517 [Stachybotrys elegans]
MVCMKAPEARLFSSSWSGPREHVSPPGKKENVSKETRGLPPFGAEGEVRQTEGCLRRGSAHRGGRVVGQRKKNTSRVASFPLLCCREGGNMLVCLGRSCAGTGLHHLEPMAQEASRGRQSRRGIMRLWELGIGLPSSHGIRSTLVQALEGRRAAGRDVLDRGPDDTVCGGADRTQCMSAPSACRYTPVHARRLEEEVAMASGGQTWEAVAPRRYACAPVIWPRLASAGDGAS